MVDLTVPIEAIGKTAPRPQREALPPSLRGQGAAVDALYVHVPFCATKCHYCDFYSLAGHLHHAEAYLVALQREIELCRQFFGGLRPRTIYIGGGTPTLLPVALLERLLALVRGAIDDSALAEFSIEANPNTFDEFIARVLTAAGVNRISFGAQSFNPAELAMLQRDHDPESVDEAFAIARRAGIENLNADLIFGIPGQNLASWEHSLARALRLEPTHLSCYSLTYEPQTAMTTRLARGDFARMDEETELALFAHVYDRLSAAGFRRYETSNYAKIQHGIPVVCAHNMVYWKAGNWLGWGPSAGSHMALPAVPGPPSQAVAWQWKNVGSLAHYLGALDPSKFGVDALPPVTQLESLSRRKWAAGAAVFWLRLDEGLTYREFLERTGVDVREDLRHVLEPFAREGLVELTPLRARIRQAGVAVSNHLLRRVLQRLEPIRDCGDTVQ